MITIKISLIHKYNYFLFQFTVSIQTDCSSPSDEAEHQNTLQRGFYPGHRWHRRVQRGGSGGPDPPFPGPPLFICDPPSNPTRSHRQM